jgi:hypothetical protein
VAKKDCSNLASKFFCEQEVNKQLLLEVNEGKEQLCFVKTLFPFELLSSCACLAFHFYLFNIRGGSGLIILGSGWAQASYFQLGLFRT